METTEPTEPTTTTTITTPVTEDEAAQTAAKAAKRDATFKLMRSSLKKIIKITGVELEAGGAQEQYFECIVNKVHELKAKVDAVEEEKRKVLEEETKLGAQSMAAAAAAAAVPPPALIEDPDTNARIQEARRLVKGAKDKFPDETGLEVGLVFHDLNGIKYVIIGYDKARPVNGIVCVAHKIVIHTATGFLHSHIHYFRCDFVVGRLSTEHLGRVRDSRVSKLHSKFHFPTEYTTDGFFLELESETRRCKIYDILPFERKRPIKIVCTKSQRIWSYPAALLLDKAVSILTHEKRVKEEERAEAKSKKRAATAAASSSLAAALDSDDSEDDFDFRTCLLREPVDPSRARKKAKKSE